MRAFKKFMMVMTPISCTCGLGAIYFLDASIGVGVLLTLGVFTGGFLGFVWSGWTLEEEETGEE